MLRLLISLVVVAVSLVTVAPAAPLPAEAKQPEDYCLTSLGAMAYYEPTSVLFRKEVRSVEKVDGAKLVSLEVGFFKKDVPYGYSETMRVTAEGVYLVENPGQANETTECVLKMPVKGRSEWKTGRAKYVATGPEEVQVPAGRFQAIKVVSEEPGPPKVTRSQWFAKGLGVVKMSTQIGKEPAVDVVLKLLTPPKP